MSMLLTYWFRTCRSCRAEKSKTETCLAAFRKIDKRALSRFQSHKVPRCSFIRATIFAKCRKITNIYAIFSWSVKPLACPFEPQASHRLSASLHNHFSPLCSEDCLIQSHSLNLLNIFVYCCLKEGQCLGKYLWEGKHKLCILITVVNLTINIGPFS